MIWNDLSGNYKLVIWKAAGRKEFRKAVRKGGHTEGPTWVLPLAKSGLRVTLIRGGSFKASSTGDAHAMSTKELTVCGLVLKAVLPLRKQEFKSFEEAVTAVREAVEPILPELRRVLKEGRARVVTAKQIPGETKYYDTILITKEAYDRHPKFFKFKKSKLLYGTGVAVIEVSSAYELNIILERCGKDCVVEYNNVDAQDISELKTLDSFLSWYKKNRKTFLKMIAGTADTVQEPVVPGEVAPVLQIREIAGLFEEAAQGYREAAHPLYVPDCLLLMKDGSSVKVSKSRVMRFISLFEGRVSNPECIREQLFLLHTDKDRIEKGEFSIIDGITAELTGLIGKGEKK